MPDVAVASRSFSRHPILRAELASRYADVRFNDSGSVLAGPELHRFLAECPRAIIALERVDEPLLAALPMLKVISKYGVGVDGLDLDAMDRHGVNLGWTPGVNRRSVAELVVAFAILLLRRIPAAAKEIQDGHWRQIMGRTLTGRTVGIIGCGHVGKDVCRLLRAFECTLLSHDIKDYPDFYSESGVTPVALDVLIERAEVITLHLPLDETTRNIISAERLTRLRRDSVLINTARGGLVDEEALAAALTGGRIAGAAFDVFATEPPDLPALMGAPNFLATPHLGGSTEEAILAMGRAAIEGLERARRPSDHELLWPSTSSSI